MKKRVVKILKVLGGSVAAVLLLLGVLTLLLNTRTVQNRLLREATALLQTQLGTHVDADSVSLSLFSMDITLHGVCIDDKEQRQMLAIEKLSARLSPRPLLRHEVEVQRLEVDGMDAMLLKPSKDQPANYQFLLDAFRKDKNEPADSHTMHIHVSRLRLRRVHVVYNTLDVYLHDATYKAGKHLLSIEGLKLHTDNHLPRKNTNKPHRGYFDPGHLHLTANMKWRLHLLRNDSLSATLQQCTVRDSVTGIDVADLHCHVEASKERLRIRRLTLQQANTVVNVPLAVIQLPHPKKATPLTFVADTITGRATLKDISRPFAPVLKDFKTPLNFSLSMSGTGDTISLRHIRINTDNRQLQIAATGEMTNLSKNKEMHIRFHVSRMQAKGATVENIIRQLPVKRFMMKQLRRIGDLTYGGRVTILWKKQHFQGLLRTAGGPIDLHLSVDGLNKYLSGSANSGAFDLGKVMDVNHLGSVACHADFKFDISKRRTARMRRQKGGKLPIGTVSAVVDDCSYRKIHVRNLFVDLKSDGAEAHGDILQQGKFRDLYCTFRFTDTDQMHKMKIIKPGVKFHKRLTPEQRKKK